MALISAFLDELAADSELLESYLDDPEATMTGYGLTEAQQGLIQGNDLPALRSELEREVGPKPYIIVHKGIVHSSDPGQGQDPPA